MFYGAIMKETWGRFMDSVAGVTAYSQLVKRYREKRPEGSFFYLTFNALRNELLMAISRQVGLCRAIGEKVDIGPAAKSTLADLEQEYKKLDTEDRNVLDFPDCGVKVMRDKSLAHFGSQIKKILDKNQYKITLKWETVERTISSIDKFCKEVEEHNQADWQSSTILGDVHGVEHGFDSVMTWMEMGHKYDDLSHKIALRGKCTVSVDWTKHEIVVHDD
jgi:hypothetical protein